MGLSVFVIALALFASQPQPQEADPGDQDAAAETQEPSDTPTINQVANAQDSEQPAADQQTYAQQILENLATNPIAWVTIGLLLVAASQAGITFYMLKISRAVERAYLYVRGVTHFVNYAPGKEPEIMVTVINSGRTPGRIIEAGIATVPVKAIEFLPRPMPDPRMQSSNLTVVAGQHIDWGNKLDPVEKSDSDLVNLNGWTLVVFGRIVYMDTFEQRHNTDFSFVYNPKRQPAGATKIDFVIDPNGYSDAN